MPNLYNGTLIKTLSAGVVASQITLILVEDIHAFASCSHFPRSLGSYLQF
jgi:hypothetical protein